MNDLVAGAAVFGASLLAGGTFEKVILLVIVLAAILAVVLLAWLLFKLLVLVGKGLFRAATSGAARAREHRTRRAAERVEALPPAQAGWKEEGRASLRRTLREARRFAEEGAPWAIVVCGEGAEEIERDLAIASAACAEVRFAMSERLVLVDASRASERTLRLLARRLSWRRPFDAVIVLAPNGRIPPQAMHRAALLARGAGFTAALHVVLPGSFGGGAARLVEPQRESSAGIRSDLESALARKWLGGAGREGLGAGSGALGDELDEGVRALRDRAPRSLELAGVVAGGGRLPEAIAATATRTSPHRGGALAMRAATVALTVGIGLGVAGTLHAVRDAERLERLVDTVRGQRVERVAGADLVPDPARAGAIAGLATDLHAAGGATWTRPTGRWLPGAAELRALASGLLVAYVGRPLGDALERRIVNLLAPAPDLETWTERAARADRLASQWEALLADPDEADAGGLLEAAFGEHSGGWPREIGAVLGETGAVRWLERIEVVNRTRIRDASREGLLASAREAARRRYLDGPVLAGARKAVDPGAGEADRHAALSQTREALVAPESGWLVAPEDRLHHTRTLPVLARAMGLSIVDGAWVAMAEAELSRARRKARSDALRIAGPELGPVLERAGVGTSLRLSGAARAWLDVLDRLEAARLGPDWAGHDDRPAVAGPVTLDAERIRMARARIGRYEEIETAVPAVLPPSLAGATMERARNRLAAGLVREVEAALVPLPTGVAHGEPSIPDRELVDAIEATRRTAGWLGDHGWSEAQRGAREVADRVVATHLRLGMDVLRATNPIRVELGRNAAGRERARERLARSIDALRALYRTHAEPFLTLAGDSSGEAARSWRSLARALDAHERGDARSGIGALESFLDGYAADPRGTCAAPSLPPAPSGYLGFVVRRVRSQLETACRRDDREELLAARDRILASFDAALARSWPYSGDPASPDAPREAVDRYVSSLASGPDLSGLDTRHATDLARERALWMLDEEGAACIGFGIEWRARPDDDENAHHLISIGLEGVKRSEDGYAWRYGTPITLRLALARNSPYRFAGAGGGRSLEHVERFEGSAALLRWLDSLERRGWTVRARLVDGAGTEAELALSVRVLRQGGAPLEFPVFAALGRGLGGPGA